LCFPAHSIDGKLKSGIGGDSQGLGSSLG